MKSYLQSALPSLVALSLVWGFLYHWSLGFSALTTYSYVVKAAAPMPKLPPAIQLIDQNRDTWSLSELKGKFFLLTFAYLDCSGTCPTTLGQFLMINHQLSSKKKPNLHLITLTLDPEWDKVESLRHFWESSGKPKYWTLATPGEVNRRAYWEQLRNMGMWVDQDSQGQPIHDNRTFLINPKGLLVQSFSGVPSLDDMQPFLNPAS